MPLNVFYITNRPDVALTAEKYGVNRIWIDLETLGKQERQGHVDSVKSHHSVEDIRNIKPLLTSAEMLVRVQPWNEKSPDEIETVIDAGADIIMLPMWKSVNEVRGFLSAANHRVKTTLLLETKEAIECIDEVLKLDFDEIHIGLNDLHLSYGQTFMFEPLANGTVEKLCEKFKKKGIPYGFGGIARLGEGLLPAEKIIMEHYRLGSTRAILSRSFCDSTKLESIDEIDRVFASNMKKLREFEAEVELIPEQAFLENKQMVATAVDGIVKRMQEAKR